MRSVAHDATVLDLSLPLFAEFELKLISHAFI